jgi:hypothetical protein
VTNNVNDIGELWSLPWHSLQSNVAERFGIVTALNGSARCARAVTPVTANWLMRALTLPPQKAPSGAER